MITHFLEPPKSFVHAPGGPQNLVLWLRDANRIARLLGGGEVFSSRHFRGHQTFEDTTRRLGGAVEREIDEQHVVRIGADRALLGFPRGRAVCGVSRLWHAARTAASRSPLSGFRHHNNLPGDSNLG